MSHEGGMQVAVLSIAGSDSGGGAGIQADLATFAKFGVRGTTAITAITAQNSRGVRAWTAVDPALVREQIEAVAEGESPRAVKSGMLANAAIVAVVAEAIARHALGPYVLDPVTVAGTGQALASGDLTPAILACLVPLADLVTPNLAEAEALTGEPVRDLDDMARAARALIHKGARAALVKGGHLTGDIAIDVLCTGDTIQYFERPRLNVRTHGTGCRLSAAIAASLALGAPMDAAVEAAGDFVHSVIAAQ
jgi:hydroxymethylpyrimidine/phosphomethylpyrimidine kinase